MPDKRTFHQIDLNLLKVFESLYLEQNMTKTAAALHITPSAVSHAVKRLRELLQDPLFVRQGASMQPTPSWRRLAPDLLATLKQLRSLLAQFGTFDPLTSTHAVTLAIHDALEPLFIPSLLSALSRDAPNGQLSSVKLERENLTAQLAAGQADFAIDIALPLKSPIRHTRLSSSPFCVLMGANNPLRKNMTAAQYIDSEHITVSNRPTGRVIEDIAFAQKGLIRKVKMRCQNYQTARQVLTGTNLILTLPEAIANSFMDDSLVVKPMPLGVPQVETHLYWHSHTEEDGALKWYREKVISLFDENNDGSN